MNSLCKAFSSPPPCFSSSLTSLLSWRDECKTSVKAVVAYFCCSVRTPGICQSIPGCCRPVAGWWLPQKVRVRHRWDTDHFVPMLICPWTGRRGREGFTMKRENFEGKIPESLGNIGRGSRALKEPLLSASRFFFPPSGKIPKLLWLGTNYSFDLPVRKARWGQRNSRTQWFWELITHARDPALNYMKYGA